VRSHLQNSKTTRAKWTGCTAQGVEHLLYKCEALGSSQSTTKKRKKNGVCIQKDHFESVAEIQKRASNLVGKGIVALMALAGIQISLRAFGVEAFMERLQNCGHH
jgi:hypothetical protein